MERNKSSFVLDVDLLTLRSLLAIVELGSFSAAAKKVGRSQSAVSLQIAKLEERMQVNLLERNSRSVKLTSAGETFLTYAKRVIEISDEGFAAVATMEIDEPLRVGIAEYLVPQHLEIFLSSLKRGFPNSKIELKLGFGFQLYDDLKNSKLDIIVAGPEGDGGILLFSEPLVWVGSKYFDNNNSEELELIQMGSPCSYRKAALQSLDEAGILWSESVSLNTIQGIQSAVSAGFGVSTMPKSAVLNIVDIINEGLPKLPKTTINLFYNQTNPHPLTKRFIDLFKEELKKIGLYD